MVRFDAGPGVRSGLDIGFTIKGLELGLRVYGSGFRARG